jgi:hypothetical protein
MARHVCSGSREFWTLKTMGYERYAKHDTVHERSVLISGNAPERSLQAEITFLPREVTFNDHPDGKIIRNHSYANNGI